MTDEIENNNKDLENEGIEILDTNFVDIKDPESEFLKEPTVVDDSSELGLGDDPDNDDEVDFDFDEDYSI